MRHHAFNEGESQIDDESAARRTRRWTVARRRVSRHVYRLAADVIVGIEHTASPEYRACLAVAPVVAGR